MFFEENEINEGLNCPICLNRYDKPYNLPCGKSVCHQCLSNISVQIDENSNEFECCLCNKYHCSNKIGFPINEPLMKLLNKKPADVYRSKIVEDLKVILKEIESKQNEFEYILKNGMEKISETCLDIRTDVQLATESAIFRINEQSDAMLKEIDEYEKEFICCFNVNKIETEKFTLFIKEMDEFHQYWKGYLKKIKVSEDEIAKCNELAKILKIKIFIAEKKLTNLIFNKKCIKFEKKIFDNNVFGFIKLKNNSESISFGELKLKNISAILADSLPNTIDLCEKEDGNLYILYINSSNCLKCITISKDLKLISTYTYNTQPVKSFKKYKNVLVASILKKFYFVQTLNLNLEPISSVNIHNTVSVVYDLPANCLCANDTNVYYLSCYTIPLIIFNRQLEFISIIGQSNKETGLFYFPRGIKQLECQNGYYYCLNEKNFQILNEKNGLIEKSIDIVADQFEIDSNNNIIILDQKNKKIIHFNCYGLKLREIELLDFNIKPLFFSDGYNFFDKNNLDLILYD